MSKVVFLIKLTLLMMCLNMTYGADLPISKPATETIVLELPEDERRDWKDLMRDVTKGDSRVEFIPEDQTVASWSDSISIQFIDKINIKRKSAISIDEAVAALRETLKITYPGNKITWNIIEKNNSDIIYEWILHAPYKDVPPIHEIARIFLRDEGIHRIGIEHRYESMSPDERSKAINTLKNRVSIQKIKGLLTSDRTLSRLYRFHEEFVLGSDFDDWGTSQIEEDNIGYSATILEPKMQKDPLKLVFLELVFLCEPLYRQLGTIEKVIAEQMRKLEEYVGSPVKMQILEQKPQETLFHFVVPYNQNVPQFEAVERVFVNDKGCHLIKYNVKGQCRLKNEEIQSWKERLEQISVTKAYRPLMSRQEVGKDPRETIVFSPPPSDVIWKENCRYISIKHGLVEYSPKEPLDEGISLIRIEFADQIYGKSLNKNNNTIEEVIEHFKGKNAGYPTSENIAFEVLQKNPSDVIYEARPINPSINKTRSVSYGRIFLTEEGVHQIHILNKGPMTPAERDKWIDALKNETLLQSLKETSASKETLSLAYRFDRIILGSEFNDWKVSVKDIGNVGFSAIIRNKSQEQGNLVRENLTTLFYFFRSFPEGLDELIKHEQNKLEKTSLQKNAIVILKKEPTEAIYHYVIPASKDKPQVHRLVRVIQTEKGYHSFRYDRACNSELSHEEIQKWKEKLEGIQVCDLNESPSDA